MGKPLLGSAEMKALVREFFIELRSFLGMKRPGEWTEEEWEEMQEERGREEEAAIRRRKRQVKKIERLKNLARTAVEPFYESSWWEPAALGDAWENEDEDGEGELGEDLYKRKLATFISYYLDDWENLLDENGENADEETLQKFREVQSDQLLEMLQYWDANYGGIESADENPTTIFGTGSQVISIPWPNDDTTPEQFPAQTKPFRLVGIAVNGNVPPPGATTLDVRLTVTDGAGNVFFTADAGPTVGQGDFSLQFTSPNQLPEGGIIVLPSMRCELHWGPGGTPPAGTYSMGTTVWMIDTSPIPVAP